MDRDCYLFNIGENFRAEEFLGAHPVHREGKIYFYFALWAPNARSVYVRGDWDHWASPGIELHPIPQTGIWRSDEIELPLWSRYKFWIESAEGDWLEKSDPFARHCETRPGTASILYDEAPFPWTDAAFLAARSRAEDPQPLNIYEVHLGSWRRYPDGSPYNYKDIAPELASYVQEMGYNAVEFMPLTEYPLDDSWGYQVGSYFAPTSRYGTPWDLKVLINTLHEKGIRVILDWVPAHFPKDSWGLGRFDGAPCFEHSDPRLGCQPEWGTYVFDFDKKEVQSFLLSSARFWIESFHMDGLRVDAVSSMLYLDYGRKADECRLNPDGSATHWAGIRFLQRLNGYLAYHFPQVLRTAEESTPFPAITRPTADGGLGFSHKWNMGWMHDTLDYMKVDYYARHHLHDRLTFSLTYAFSERFILPFSHDEVVHGKHSLIGRMPGDIWRQCASLRFCFAWQIAHPGAKLNFMGNEWGQFIEWRFKEELEWFMLQYPHHRQLQAYSRALNHLYLSESALWMDQAGWKGFEWVQVDDRENEVYAFIRRDPERGEALLWVLNGTPKVHPVYRIQLPNLGTLELLFNSDQTEWGGSDYGALRPGMTWTIQSDQLADDCGIDPNADTNDGAFTLSKRNRALQGCLKMSAEDGIDHRSEIKLTEKCEADSDREADADFCANSSSQANSDCKEPSAHELPSQPWVELKLPPLSALVFRLIESGHQNY